MLVGIHNRYSDTKHDDIEIYKKILEFNGIDYIELNCSDRNFWDQVSKIDRFIYKWSNASNDYQIAHAILPIIENHLKIKCFPNQATCWHYDDKIRQYYLLKAYGYPVAEVYRIEQDEVATFSNAYARPTARLDRHREVLMVWPQIEEQSPANENKQAETQ